MFRNSICAAATARAGTARSTSTTSLAVSSDAFFYKLGEDFYNTPGTQLQDQRAACSGSAPTPASTCRSSSTAGCRRTSSRSSCVERGVLGEDEAPNTAAGDLLQLAIGQGLLAATPLQLAVGYAAFANGGCVLTPHVVQAISSPETPDGEPGFVDLDPGRSSSRDRRRPSRPDPDAARAARPDRATASGATSPGPGVNGRSTTGRGAVRTTTRPTRSRSPARPAPPRAPAATRGTTRRRSPRSASTRASPYTVRVVPREVRVRLDGRGAGRQVHVPRPVGHASPLDPVASLRAARHRRSERARRVAARPSTPACMAAAPNDARRRPSPD